MKSKRSKWEIGLLLVVALVAAACLSHTISDIAGISSRLDLSVRADGTSYVQARARAAGHSVRLTFRHGRRTSAREQPGPAAAADAVAMKEVRAGGG